ncbi:MAG: undecaprenyl-diphosphatase UppP [Minisyncoccia bacterium]
MTYITAIILGIVEGATEFIPVSSSGHLIIVRQILGENVTGGLAFDAILQFAAVFALIVYFRREVWELVQTFWDLVTHKNISEKDKTLFWAILLGTIPAIVFGLLLESQMDTIFRNVKLVSGTLILGSLLFWIADRVSIVFEGRHKALNLWRGVLVGFFQCLALVPGVSRSGATISGGLILGLQKDEAIKFSFLLSIPILLGSGLKKMIEVRHDILSSDFGIQLLLGSLTAFVVGYLSIKFLITYLKNHNLNVFIWYRVALALLILISF